MLTRESRKEKTGEDTAQGWHGTLWAGVKEGKAGRSEEGAP